MTDAEKLRALADAMQQDGWPPDLSRFTEYDVDALRRTANDIDAVCARLRKHDKLDDCEGCGCMCATLPELVEGIIAERDELRAKLDAIAERVVSRFRASLDTPTTAPDNE